jgi:AraC-like DNA-binding protein
MHFLRIADCAFVTAQAEEFHLTLMQINRSLSGRAYFPRTPRLGMPSSTVRAFTDPDAYFAGIRNLSINGFVTERGKFRADATLIDLHRLQMGRFDEDLPRIMRITPSGARSLILFATNPTRPAMLANGLEASQNQIAMFGLHWPYYLRSSAASEWGTMSLIPEDLAAAGRAIIGRELMPPRFMLPIMPPTSSLSRVLQLHGTTSHLARTAPDILAKPEVARAIEEALVEAMVFCLAGTYPEQVRNVHHHRATVMRRLEDTLRAKSDKPLYMAELCAAVGATYWAVRDCCLEYLGMSPKRYLWMRRMNLARRALRSADPEHMTVTEIATNYGFWELGRFSVTYRSFFGESPSATLRRMPECSTD